MALKTGDKQFFQVNVGTGATTIGFIKDCFGAKYLLCKAYDAQNGNTFTPTAQGSPDGINVNDSGAPGLVIKGGTGAANGATGIFFLIMMSDVTFTTALVELLFPYIRLSGSFGTAGGITSFDVWPVYEVNHPNIPLGNIPSGI